MERLLRPIYTVSQFMQLDQSERWLIVEAGFYMLWAKIATITTPARTLLALGNLPPHAVSPPRGLPEDVRQATEAVEKSSLYLGFDNCLIRALALRMLLARRDVPTELHIGARKDEHDEFAAHAWLTYHDTILLGGDDATVLYRELVGSHHLAATDYARTP